MAFDRRKRAITPFIAQVICPLLSICHEMLMRLNFCKLNVGSGGFAMSCLADQLGSQTRCLLACELLVGVESQSSTRGVDAHGIFESMSDKSGAVAVHVNIRRFPLRILAGEAFVRGIWPTPTQHPCRSAGGRC